MERISRWWIAVWLLLLAVGCSDDNGAAPVTDDVQREQVKLAVILPMGSADTQWTQVLDWVKQNIREANTAVEPEYELYDENAVDIYALGEELAGRQEVAAVIGCVRSVNTLILSYCCAKTRKPVFTFSTSAALPRVFGQAGFLWGLAESDITQCELMLMKAKMYGAKTVSLLASDDIYGQTFTDWFAFQAVEIGVSVQRMVTYAEGGVEEGMRQVLAVPADFLVCAPASTADAVKAADVYQQSGFVGRMMLSDMAYNASLITGLGSRANGIMGLASSADPDTGFNVSYHALFGKRPDFGEAHVYDAVMIACYAYRYAALHGMTDLNEAVAALLNQPSEVTGRWTAEAMADIYREMEQGGTPSVSGASSNLDFSTDNYTTVQYSSFVHWMAYEGRFIDLDYDSRSGSSRSSTYAAWEWNKQFEQSFDDPSETITYPEKTGNWVVIVAAGRSWTNYRFQADALAVYQGMKECGIDDDHILLIMEDDIAYNPVNPYPGIVRRTKDGPNLYKNVEVDYRLSDLTPQDWADIMLGRKENSLQAAPTDNVLLFWSGHGNRGELMWGPSDAVSADLFAQTLRQLSDRQGYRKLLCFIEACYSGSVAERCEGIPGLLLFTAANADETSKADLYNTDLNVWMTNRFTSALLEECDRNPSIPLRELYLKLFHQTQGSHVSVYNAPLYGSVYANTMKEFLM